MFHKYDNFTLITRRFRQRLVCFTLTNYVYVLMDWVSNNLVLVLGGTG